MFIGGSSFFAGFAAGFMMAQAGRGQTLSTVDSGPAVFYQVASVFISIPGPVSDAWIRAIGVWLAIGALLGATVVLVVAALNWSRRAAWRSEFQARSRRHEAESERLKIEEQEAARRRNLDALRQEAERFPAVLVSHYREAVGQADLAAEYLRVADEHLRRPAFSPFWESVEAAVTAVNVHRLSVEHLTRAFADRSRLIERIALSEARDVQVPAIPTEMSVLSECAVGDPLTARIREIVLTAQEDIRFSTIYEQRRTTTAVLQGFTSIQDALDRLGAVCREGYDMVLIAMERQANIEQEQTGHGLAMLASIENELASPSHTMTLGREVHELNQSLRTLQGRLGV